LSNVLRAVTIGVLGPTTLLAVAQAPSNALATVLVTTDRARLGHIAFGIHDDLNAFGFGLVFE
jgi:hypothetical protein